MQRVDRDQLSRLANVRRIAGWAGGDACFATLDGAPVLYVNQAALADFLDEGDRGPPLDYALKFESESEREDFRAVAAVVGGCARRDALNRSADAGDRSPDISVRRSAVTRIVSIRVTLRPWPGLLAV